MANTFIRSRFIRITLALTLLFSINSQADTLNIAVASNFLSTAQTLKEQFEQSTEHSVKIISASTGQLSHQIANGAPFDVFLAANKKHPTALQQQLKLPAENIKPYALGKLVFLSRSPLYAKNAKSNPGFNSQALKQFLTAASTKRIAIANKKLAPYGQASVEVLEHLQLSSSIKPKLITGQNISQAFQFFQSGNTHGAFVASALITSHVLKQNPDIIITDIPLSLHNPIEQYALLLTASTSAKAFYDYLLSHKAQQLIQQHGYGHDL